MLQPQYNYVYLWSFGASHDGNPPYPSIYLYQVLIIWLFEAHTVKIKLYNVAINISLFDAFTMTIGPFFLLHDAISMKIVNSMKYNGRVLLFFTVGN